MLGMVNGVDDVQNLSNIVSIGQLDDSLVLALRVEIVSQIKQGILSLESILENLLKVDLCGHTVSHFTKLSLLLLITTGHFTPETRSHMVLSQPQDWSCHIVSVLFDNSLRQMPQREHSALKQAIIIRLLFKLLLIINFLALIQSKVLLFWVVSF